MQLCSLLKSDLGTCLLNERLNLEGHLWTKWKWVRWMLVLLCQNPLSVAAPIFSLQPSQMWWLLLLRCPYLPAWSCLHPHGKHWGAPDWTRYLPPARSTPSLLCTFLGVSVSFPPTCLAFQLTVSLWLLNPCILCAWSAEPRLCSDDWFRCVFPLPRYPSTIHLDPTCPLGFRLLLFLSLISSGYDLAASPQLSWSCCLSFTLSVTYNQWD